jgi:succinyl-diaminopimelate desuccinylase
MPIHDSLRSTLLDITAVPSPIGDEEALCNVIEDRLLRSLGGDAVTRHQHSLVVRAAVHPDRPRIALVGHLDTVPTEHDGPARS